ncbi:cupin domain-containing protein [Endozoicomonas sp. SM1973]|uniref:Cupin domain-containing protein n=1 Tax=Spartinivicinus marinus TaxID=2994442 RepID=A0A853IEI3_9GAMM|nr:cupin domain-containing protein [Spartinivicinus marinus]MCX4027322.1 cupin domain-containing protein [Spartinivicinus marinus]NYZ68454.1 cupin domain-containing protein [Spartinivicinus marinus]
MSNESTFAQCSKVNADFSKRIVISTDSYQWVESPVKGVTRMMLDRVGMEAGRATSLVRYEPNSSFTDHIHTGGEEIFVIEGIFVDEHGQYPAGSYIRNPIGTSHSPQVGEDGALIFVKLHQFDPADTSLVRINTQTQSWHPGLVVGLTVMPLHEFQGEKTALVKWAPNTQFKQHIHPGGEEILVLEGTFYDEEGVYPAGTWLRNPPYSRHTPCTKKEGALIYVKVGHLPLKS